MTALTYAKAGVTPGAWATLQVMDLAAGAVLDRVVEVDTKAGWIKRVKVDDAGVVVVDPATAKPIIEQIFGGFEIQPR